MDSPVSDEIAALFRPPASGTVLVITAGNPYRSDDGVGPYIAGGVTLSKDYIVILDAGERPENIIDKAIGTNPSRTVIIDAADFGGLPGEMRVIPEGSVPHAIHSTHSFPLNIVSRLIREDTGSEVTFLGIQCRSIDFGETLSAEVLESARKIISLISRSNRES